MAHICGPWRTDFHGGFRYRMCSGDGANDAPEQESEITPAPPERKTPPAVECRPITDRTNEIARKLIDSVFTKGEPS
jgi:hypothetical protein